MGPPQKTSLDSEQSIGDGQFVFRQRQRAVHATNPCLPGPQEDCKIVNIFHVIKIWQPEC